MHENIIRFPVTHYLLEQNVFSESPFTVIDVGCSGGISEYWRVFGHHLRAYAFDPMIAEIEHLQAVETNPNIKYYAQWISLPDDHPLIKSRASKSPLGNRPWKRLSAAWAVELLIKNANTQKELVKLNEWEETRLTDRSNRIGISEFASQNHIDSIDFIKIDVDGEDFYALTSCEDIINSSNVLGMMLEVNYFGTDNETDNTFHNTDRYMRKHGFTLFDLNVRRYSRRSMPAPFVWDIPAQTIWGAPLQGDALYMKDVVQSAINNEPLHIPLDKLLKLICMFEILNLPDCAAEVIMTYKNQLSESIEVKKVLNLLTPEFEGKKLSYEEYIHMFSENVTRFYPSQIKRKNSWRNIFRRLLRQ